MNQINTQTKNTSEVIKQLGGKSEEIGNIISLITSIAEQTNLLALNATIEAARAGEHGIAKESANHAQNVAASTEESNASMEEVTTSAESLAKMAEELQETVRVFKL
ncbi:methyl-accepting chemotaxis protein [Bacillus sp. FJAT-45350]|uniref:methyl-accepting chemotaxis protein n=1 Tax=Bacillus sp. FJAT-45350 TaxID=2011014 RepID=UPI000BB81DC3|nr:methyl-accepting chemotaxis protein [Bacillus sp. FJAT-45350]